MIPAPYPTDPQESARWMESRRRRRMLHGQWREDLEGLIRAQVGHIRAEAWGAPDLSSNVFRSSVAALATLYDRPPHLSHPAPLGEALVAEVAAAGWWFLAARNQRDTLGMRENLVRVDVVGGELHYRLVPADLVVLEPDPEVPSRPIAVREARLRHGPAGEPRWTWDSWDARTGQYRILGFHAHEDLTADYLEEGEPRAMVPDPERPGRYVLPYVLYHAAVTGELWDPFELRELVEGSLWCALLWTFVGHVMRAASWPQRWAIGAVPAGAVAEGTANGNRAAVVTDPATVSVWAADESSTGSPQLGQWDPGADPVAMVEAAGAYERRVAAYAGISPADVQRVAGDPRSGFAIALNREAQRESQRRFGPVFLPSDLELLRVSAALLGAAQGVAYPLAGYSLTYQSLPPAPEEREAEREHVAFLLSNGLTSKADALRVFRPDLSAVAAEAYLAALEPPAPQPPPPTAPEALDTDPDPQS